MTRRQLRESTLMLVFQNIFKQEDCVDILEVNLQAGLFDIDNDVRDYFFGIEENKEEIDIIIKKYLKNWKIDRISKISLSILRIAFYEIIYKENMETNIVISEAVEISKNYLDQDDTAFINGVLGAYSKDI
ncbi:MAG: transcription antitermination factor NusB [Oscillospiraceae bacterium]|nr:transcription antitermination factor NusB [Oscillospiraceae bacterium]